VFIRNTAKGHGVHLLNYLRQHAGNLAFLTYQHASLSFQAVLVGSVVAVLIAMTVYRLPLARVLTLTSSRVALTIPSLALLALLLIPFGLGVVPSFVMLAFFAAMPVIGNTIVGLRSVPDAVIEAARGIGLPRWRILLTVELPIAWPVMLTGVRVSTQMIVGVAAIVAYVLGPGLGSLIFNGLSRLGGANALEMALTGTILIVLVALAFDALLVLLGRLTISEGLS
jgi:osmoprotectant transport system permease protein